jgi:hypothetical protein
MQTSAFAQSQLINFYAQPSGTSVVSGPAVWGGAGGLWNGLTSANGTISSAVDSLGNTTTVSLSMSGSGGSSDSMSVNGETAATVLLESSYWNLTYWGQGAITMTLSGLTPNTDYELVSYMTGRGAGSGGTATWVDGTGTTIAGTTQCTDNSQEASFTQGVNYALLVGQSDGSGKIVFTVTADPNKDAAWAWNGLQIMPYVSAAAIATQPQTTTITAGNTARFTVVATGSSPLNYQWSLSDGTILTNNSHYSGCTNSTLIINNVSIADEVSYTVTVTNSSGSATSDPATLIVNPLATNMVNFFVSISQSMSGPAVVGSPNDIWNPVQSSGSTSGCIDVLGNYVGDNISITGYNWSGTDGVGAGSITANLFDDTLLNYSGAALSITVTGLAANTDYVMYNYTIGGGANSGGTITWIDGTGKTNTATADNLQYITTSYVLNQNYTVLTGRSDTNGTIHFTLSNVADPCWNGMQIFPASAVPQISVQPQSTTNSVGSIARFTVGATGTGLTYQWSWANGTILTNNAHITGATSSTLTINNVSPTDAGSYIVKVTGSQGGVTNSQSATLTISTNPLLSNVQININGNGNYSGAGILGYSGDLWNEFNNQYVSSIGLLDSFGNPTPVIFSLTGSGGSGNDSSGDDGNGVSPLLTSYYSTSSSMTVTLSGLNTNAVYIIITYHAGTAYGQGATLGGALTGTAPASLTFSTLNMGDDCLGNTNVVTDNSGKVTFTVSPASGQSVGAFNGLQIEQQNLLAGVPPALSQVVPQTVTNYVGQSATFFVRALSATPITSYKWMLNNVPLTDATGHISGSSTPMLTVSSMQLTDAGTYTVVVQNTSGASTNNAILTVLSTVNPTTANLVGEWLAGPASLADTSGYQPSGTHNASVQSGSIHWTNDVPPNATSGSCSLYFNNAGLLVTNSSDLDGNYMVTFNDTINSVMTVTFWAKGLPGTWNPWVSKYGENSLGWQLRVNGDGKTPCWTIRGTGGSEDMSSTLGTNDGNWHFYAGTFDVNAGVRNLYVDGVLAATQTGQGSLTPSPDSHLMIGARDSGGNSFGNYFTGEIYGVRIYSTALSADQVNYLNITPPPATVTPPVVPWFSGQPVLQGSQFVLTWYGGSLLQATNITGPWTLVAGATSPYTNIISAAPQLFFRLSNP